MDANTRAWYRLLRKPPPERGFISGKQLTELLEWEGLKDCLDLYRAEEEARLAQEG